MVRLPSVPSVRGVAVRRFDNCLRTSGRIHRLQRPKCESRFGQGTSGNYSPTSAFSWGDRISERAGGDDAVNNSGQFFQSLVSDNIIYPTQYFLLAKFNINRVLIKR